MVRIMSLTKQELTTLRMYMANRDTEEAKELEHKLTQEIGDQEEYYDAEPHLLKLIPKLEDEDLWRLIRLADLILSGEDGAEEGIETGQYPWYEITRQRGNGELKIEIVEKEGSGLPYYGHEDVLDQLIAYDFVKVK